MNVTSTLRLALFTVAAVSMAGCSSTASSFQSGTAPWDTETPATAAEWPTWPTAPGTVAVVSGTRFITGSDPSHAWAHGRALVDAPITAVWAAIQGEPGVLLGIYPDLPTVDCEPTLNTEPDYEVSYSVKEIPNNFGSLGRANPFTVAWRISAVRDAAQAIIGIQVKAQVVLGPSQIALMRQSIVATPAPGGGTAVEMVRHINAPPPDDVPESAVGWVNAWHRALVAQLQGTRESLIPKSYCFP